MLILRYYLRLYLASDPFSL